MSYFNIAFISLTVLSTNPSYSGEFGEAADAARRALMQTEMAKAQIKRAEKYAKKTVLPAIGMDEKDLIYFAWALPVASGRISTRPFKKLRIKTKKWTIRPEIEYKFSGNNDFSGNVVFLYNWGD